MKVTLGNINQRNNRLVSYHFKLTCSPLTTYWNALIMVITRGKFLLLKFLFSYNSTIFHWRVVRFSEVTYLEEWLSRIKENLFSERWSRSEISVLHTFQLQEQSAWGLTNLVIFFICKFQIIKTTNERKKIVTFEIHSSDLLSLAEHKINRSSNFKNFCSTPRQRNLTDLKLLIFKFINTWLLISTLVFLNAFVSKRLLCDHKYRSKCCFHPYLHWSSYSTSKSWKEMIIVVPCGIGTR